MRETFMSVISGLHHLTSTESCPGVYNSPFTAVTGGPPQIAGMTVEEHLRSSRVARKHQQKAGRAGGYNTRE